VIYFDGGYFRAAEEIDQAAESDQDE
jgi:hypothetical protein